MIHFCGFIYCAARMLAASDTYNTLAPRMMSLIFADALRRFAQKGFNQNSRATILLLFSHCFWLNNSTFLQTFISTFSIHFSVLFISNNFVTVQTNNLCFFFIFHNFFLFIFHQFSCKYSFVRIFITLKVWKVAKMFVIWLQFCNKTGLTVQDMTNCCLCEFVI